jgi:hypothetical protein
MVWRSRYLIAVVLGGCALLLLVASVLWRWLRIAEDPGFEAAARSAKAVDQTTKTAWTPHDADARAPQRPGTVNPTGGHPAGTLDLRPG